MATYTDPSGITVDCEVLDEETHHGDTFYKIQIPDGRTDWTTAENVDKV